MGKRAIRSVAAVAAMALVSTMTTGAGAEGADDNRSSDRASQTGRGAENRSSTATAVDMRHRLVESLTGGDAFHPADPQIAPLVTEINTEAQDNLDSMTLAGNPEYLWPDMETAESNFGNSAKRLRDMAIVYRTKSAALEGDSELAEAIVFGLDWLERNHYYDGSQQYGNWWWWEIGTPSAVVDALALMDDEAPDALRQRLLDAVRYHVPNSTERQRHRGVIETGANRVDKAWISVRWGVLSADGAAIAEGRDALSQVFEYVTSGDGFYRDGSFVQHGDIAYTGSYGLVLMSGLSRALNLLAGTQWEVTDAGVDNVWSWIFDSYEPITFAGQLFDHTRGRAISRIGTSNLNAGHTLFYAISNMVDAAPEDVQPRIRGYLAEMVAQDYDPYYDPRTTTATIPEILAIRSAVDGVEARGPITTHKQFPAMDRMSHFQGDWAFTVSARSSRIAGYESGNGENLHGWYTGEGMTYVYDHDYRQYSDAFWPTVDPYHLAGTTVATQDSYPRTDVNGWRQPRGEGTAGGVGLGDNGAYGMEFFALRDQNGQPNDLTGKKSWFTIGDTVVALGADVSASNVAAQTTIENRMVPDGGATLTIDGAAQSSRRDEQVLENPSWAHLADAGGYLFPDDQAVNVRGDTRTGRWSDIGANLASDPDDEATREYATLWFDHGTNPADAGYAYYLLPGRSAPETEQAADVLAAGDGLQIGDNTGDVQSVIDRDRGLAAANFWSCTSTLDLLRAQTPASVMYEDNGDGTVTVALSDPTQQQGVIGLEIARQGLEVVAADERITVETLEPTIRLRADVSDARGQAVTVTLAVDPEARPALGDGCLYVVNHALGKPAEQSSIAHSGAPQRAVDGNADGSWSSGSVTHTADEQQPWWQVDLVEDRAIDQVLLYNRTDCCADRLSDFHVLVSESPFGDASLDDLLARDDVTSFHVAEQAGRPTAIDVNTAGRYVRVQLAGSNPLSLAEVEVIEYADQPPDDAEGEIVEVVHDAYVRGGGYSDQNFDGQGLVVKQVPELTWARQTFLKFDLSELPADVGAANLKVLGNVADSGGNVTTHTVYEVADGAWDEASVTWNTKPALGQAVTTFTVTGDSPSWYTIDVTELVQQHIADGENELTLALAGPGGDTRTLAVVISDSESGENSPRLQVY